MLLFYDLGIPKLENKYREEEDRTLVDPLYKDSRTY